MQNAIAGFLTFFCYFNEMVCRLRRPVGRMTVVEQQLEGEFRYVNSRLITHRWSFRVVRSE